MQEHLEFVGPQQPVKQEGGTARCKQCGGAYRPDGRGNLCPACYDKTVTPEFRAKRFHV